MATRERSRAAASEERPLGELFGELTENLRRLVQREIELAKIELKDQVSRGAQGAGMFGGGAVAGLIGLLLLAFAAAWGLAEVLPTGFAFLIVGVVFVLVARLLFAQGKARFKQLQPVPRQTLETIKQDVQTAKNSLAEGARDDDLSRQWARAAPSERGAASTAGPSKRRVQKELT